MLCVRLDSLGDVLMTTPAIRAVRQGAPQRRVTLLTSSSGAAVGPFVPEIDGVITYDAPWNKMSRPPPSSVVDHKMIDQLRRLEFDAAIIFTVFSQNPLPAAMLCYLADIPLRLAHCHENPYYLLSNWIPDPEPASGIRHEVQRQLDLVAEVDYTTLDQRLSLQVSDADRARVCAVLERSQLALDRPWVVIHAGATAPSRRYPPELFAAAAGALVRDHDLSIVFSGTREELNL